jgi:hypothetical protein
MTVVGKSGRELRQLHSTSVECVIVGLKPQDIRQAPN